MELANNPPPPSWAKRAAQKSPSLSTVVKINFNAKKAQRQNIVWSGLTKIKDLCSL
jgi:hypothetical protein